MTFISYQNSLEKGSCFMIDIPEPSFHNTNNTPGSITNYELAYRVRQLDDLIIIIIMAGTRENFYEELKRYIRTI